jgi:hypothetical protein
VSARSRVAVRFALAVVAAVAPQLPARAQDRGPAFRPHRVTFAAGVPLSGGYPIGDITAPLRRNTTSASTASTLLRAESRVDRAAGVEARAGVAISRSIALEVAGGYSTPELSVRISNDPELQGEATASDRLSQYTVDVSALYLLPRLHLGDTARPYVLGGGGYVRQLDEARLNVHSGSSIHAGAGIQYWVRGATNRQQRPFGARAELRLVRRSGGIDFEDRSRVFPAVSVLGFIGF